MGLIAGVGMKEERSSVFWRKRGPFGSNRCTERIASSGGSLAPLSGLDGCFPLHPFPAWLFGDA